MKKFKEIDVKRVNEKYVKLLTKTYDKYKEIDILGKKEEGRIDQAQKAETILKLKRTNDGTKYAQTKI